MAATAGTRAGAVGSSLGRRRRPIGKAKVSDTASSTTSREQLKVTRWLSLRSGRAVLAIGADSGRAQAVGDGATTCSQSCLMLCCDTKPDRQLLPHLERQGGQEAASAARTAPVPCGGCPAGAGHPQTGGACDIGLSCENLRTHALRHRLACGLMLIPCPGELVRKCSAPPRVSGSPSTSSDSRRA